MRPLAIACGNSCRAKTWSNKTITWEWLCEKLQTTIRTTDTVEEYPKLKRADREAAKDKGGFVGGLLRDNRRKIETVACRSMLTLDVDNADVGFIEKFLSECRYAAALYTTHGHTPENPRLRILVPLLKDINSDQYAAVTRFFADEWGIDQFDECSYKPNQLMYWPTTPANGEYIFKVVEGDWLDPDEYLADHPFWNDCSLLPTSSRESTVRETTVKPKEDPLTKKGIVGTFCRAYSITAAIEKFLSNVYEPSAVEGRYDYIPGEGSNLNDKQSEMLSQQQIQLQESEEKLSLAEQESEKLQNQIYSLRKEMIEQENSLENARVSLEQFEKEEQAKLNRAKQEKTVAWIIAGLLLCICIGK